MKKILMPLLLFISGCGNPSLSGVVTTSTPTYFDTYRLFSDSVGITMTNAAAVGTEISTNLSRSYVDFTAYPQVRAQFASSLGTAAVLCRIEYSTNDGTSWSTLVSDFASSTTVNGSTKSSWATVPTAARGDVLVRAMIVGDGVLDPVIRYVSLDVSTN
jgi:hypothetical protein